MFILDIPDADSETFDLAKTEFDIATTDVDGYTLSYTVAKNGNILHMVKCFIAEGEDPLPVLDELIARIRPIAKSEPRDNTGTDLPETQKELAPEQSAYESDRSEVSDE